MSSRPIFKVTTERTARQHGRVLIVRFPYNTQDVARVRQLSGRRWIAKERYWMVEATATNRALLHGWGFKLLDLPAKTKLPPKSPPPPKPVQLELTDLSGKLSKELFRFQRDGVLEIDRRNGNVLLADEMGLGKTVQVLAWLRLRKDVTRTLVICPASVKYNWLREARRWCPDRRWGVLNGTKTAPPAALARFDALIINYDIVGSWKTALAAWRPTAVVMDEVQYIKTRGTKRTTHTRILAEQAKHRLAMSGMPIENRPIELFNALHIIAPQEWSSYWSYAKEFCAAHLTRFGWDITGASNIPKLHQRLKPYMIRRRKAEVLTDLPPKLRSVVLLEMSEKHRRDYDAADEDFGSWLAEHDPTHLNSAESAEGLAKTEKLRQLAAYGKMAALYGWLAEWEQAKPSGTKMIMFGVHLAIIGELAAKFGKACTTITGAVPPSERLARIAEFRERSGCRFFLGQIKAAGVGLDGLQYASRDVVFVEFDWSPATHDQAGDRAHRIGQTGAVQEWYMVAHGTIEESIVALHDEKRKVALGVLDGREAGATTSDLVALLNKERERRDTHEHERRSL